MGFNVLDLFSGIGGFSLGLEAAGMKTSAFCEIDRDCRRVIKKHWCEPIIFSDIRNLDAKFLYKTLEGHDLPRPNIICGGFPCQDISAANTAGRGLRGRRSGLWSEFFRLISEIRPAYALIENVPVLRSRGLCRVLSDLSSIGYDAEWHIIAAADIGSAHLRERIWVVAHPPGVERAALPIQTEIHFQNALERGKKARDSSGRSANPIFFDPTRRSLREIPSGILLADGVSGDMGGLIKMYGNAVVPGIPEAIGRAIIEHEQGNRE